MPNGVIAEIFGPGGIHRTREVQQKAVVRKANRVDFVRRFSGERNSLQPLTGRPAAPGQADPKRASLVEDQPVHATTETVVDEGNRSTLVLAVDLFQADARQAAVLDVTDQHLTGEGAKLALGCIPQGL